jgi:WD40 repeat protein
LYCLAFAPSGRSLLSGSSEGVVKLWSVIERKEIVAIRADQTRVDSIAFAPDGIHAVIACTGANAAKIWRLTKDIPVSALPPVGASDGWKGMEVVHTLPHKNALAGAVFTPGGDRVLTALSPEHDNGEAVSLWDIKTGKPVGEVARAVRVARVVAGGGKVLLGQNASGGLPGDRQAEIAVWDAIKNARASAFAFDSKPGRFSSLDISPDGKSVVASRYTDNSYDTAVLDLATGEYRMNRVDGYASCFVPEKDKSATTILVGFKAELRQIEIATGKVTRTLKKHAGQIQCVACSPDGRFAVSTATATTSELVLWDLAAADGAPAVLGQSKAPVHSLAFAPSGRSLLSGSDEGVLKLWDLAQRKEVFATRADTKRLSSVAFSADGTLALTAGWEGNAKVWKLTK